jgi:hypothetical protein
MKVVQTFSAPMHLVLRMDEEIGGHRKKSQWICDAIKNKIDGEESILNCSTRRLMAILHHRDDVDDHLKEELLRRLNPEH